MGVEDVEFKISVIQKIYSTPVLWKVTVELPENKPGSIEVNTRSLFTFRLFQMLFFEKTYVMLPYVRPSVWAELLASCLAPEVAMIQEPATKPSEAL